jgi:hypothetical protein
MSSMASLTFIVKVTNFARFVAIMLLEANKSPHTKSVVPL